MKRWWIVAAVLLAMQAHGAAYYLAPTGSDPAAGTIGAPWLTFDRAENTMGAGDTLFCRGGTYTTPDDFFRSRAPNMLLTNYANETPIFRTVGRDFWGRVTVMVLDQKGTKLRGLSFIPDSTVAGDIFCQVSGSNCVFDNVAVHAGKLANGKYVFSQILYLYNGDYTEVVNCRLSGAGDPTDPHGNSGNVIIGFGNYYNIHDNVMSRGVHDVVRFDGTGSIMRNNTITHADGYGIFLSHTSHRNLVEYNTFSGSDEELNYNKTPIFAKGDSNIVRFNTGWNNEKDGMVLYGKYNRIYNNTIYGNGQVGFGMKPEVPGPCHDNKIVNNVIAKNGQAGTLGTCTVWTDGRWGEMSTFLLAGNVSSNNLISYNYIVAYKNGAWINKSACAVFRDSASTFHSVSGMQTSHPSLWQNNIYNYCAPQFVNAVGGDFRIRAGSCLADAGAALTTASANGSGTSLRGSGTSLRVNDALFFWVGDKIMIGAGTERTIRSINYKARILTLDASATWSPGAPVTLPYIGAAPDIGAFELGSANNPSTPIEVLDFGAHKAEQGIDVTLDIGSPVASNSVEIRFTITRPGTPVRVSVFDVKGSRVRELKQPIGAPGEYVITWDTLDEYSGRAPRGVYLVELRAGNTRLTKKIVLLRP